MGAEESSKPQEANGAKIHIFFYKAGTLWTGKEMAELFFPKVSLNEPQAFAISQLPHQ